MKAYLVYQIRDSRGSSVEPRLYAITDNKKLLKEFLENRKESYFYTKTVDYSRKKWMEFEDKNKRSILTKVRLRTRNTEAINNTSLVELVVTQGEDELVFLQKDRVILEMSQYTRDESFAFNDEILKALSVLKYFEIHKFYNNPYASFLSGVETLLQPADLDLKIDDLALFIYFFGDTLDVKKKA